MSQEIHFVILIISCLTYHAVAMTTTLPPDYRSPEEIQNIRREQMRLGMVCQQTCSPEDYFGTCHAEYPKSCTKYINCQIEKRGNEYTWIGTAMFCSHGTFFSRDQRTCLIPELANCLLDQCVLRNEIESYPSSTSCKTYWQCVGQPGSRISTPRCCGANESYSEELQKCVKDLLCQDECTLKDLDSNRCAGNYWGPKCQNECSQNCVKGECDDINGQCPCKDGWIGDKCNTKCFFKRIDKDTYDYLGHAIPCPPGTVFSQDDCMCITEVRPVTNAEQRPKVCKVEVYTNFTGMQYGAIKNYQSNIYISNEHIEGPTRVVDGIGQYGSFDGKAYARINYFSGNTKVGKTYATRIVFRPGNGQPTEKQILMSNCATQSGTANRRAPLEIALSPDSAEVIISVYTKADKYSKQYAEESLRVKYEPNVWNILDFLLINNKLHAKIMNFVNKKEILVDDQTLGFKGIVETGRGIHIGKCVNGNGFVGEMAEVTISLCDPGLRFASAAAGARRGRNIPT
ncbi:hypothetical protein FSP39_002225 [Pinctada imbricata]|uniref:Chitin-binding type-2 domain-containing protein n=1 Tax=Pinctada imbricata TaxID=66713 RepID=A0AA89C6C5_PINIB|nr:hypothetical protein FSP39_002225 [Pinctada imbricata]